MMTPLPKNDTAAMPAMGQTSYFTLFAGSEVFELSVQHAQTIFRIASVTPVPQGPRDVAGLVNLRGRIVTAVSLRRRLRMPDETTLQNALAIGIERRGENFALVVDEVGDVLQLDDSMKIPVPPHFDPQRLQLTTGLYKVGKLLIPALDVDALFDFRGNS